MEEQRMRPDDLWERDPLYRYLPLSEREFFAESIAEHRRFHPDLDRVARLQPYYRSLIARGHADGVTILAGTDAGALGLYWGKSLHDELARLVEAGLSPLEALRAATIAPALFEGRGHYLGSIAVGKAADIVLLSSNPLDGISNTRAITYVVRAGVPFDSDKLETMLRGMEAALPAIDEADRRAQQKQAPKEN